MQGDGQRIADGLRQRGASLRAGNQRRQAAAAKLRGQRLRGRSIAQCLAERQAVILHAGDGTGSARIGIQPAALAGKHAAGKGHTMWGISRSNASRAAK